MNRIAHNRTPNNKKPAISSGLLHFFELYGIITWWRRRESNPRPEIFSCSFYTLSPRFKVRLGGLPGTGSLVGYPVSCFASPATGDQGRLSWLILRPVRAVRRTRQDEAT